MATASTSTEGATCPLCDDYTGAPSSVEAHISRMTDPIHQGEVGRAHRDELQRRVATTSDVESSDDQPVETTEEGSTDPDFPEDGGPQSEDRDTGDQGDQGGGEMPTAEELERQRERVVEDGDDQEESDDVEVVEESAGIPIPVSTGTLVVSGVVLLALYWFVFVRSGGSSDDEEETAQEAQQEGDWGAPPAGGLGGS